MRYIRMNIIYYLFNIKSADIAPIFSADITQQKMKENHNFKLNIVSATIGF
jgi:hypothetical protein